MAKFCKNCGSPLEEGVAFCEGCGMAVQTDQPQGQAQTEAVSEQSFEPQPPAPVQEQYAPPPPPPAPPQEQYAPPPPGQYGAPPVAAPKKRLPKWLLIVIIIVAVLGAIILAANLAVGNVGGKDFFEMGADKIPTVKNILGEERKVTSYESSVSSTKIQSIVVKYSVSESQNIDMDKYTSALMKDYGFYNTTPYDFNRASASGYEFMAKSTEEGYVILLKVEYDNNGYVLTYQRGEGVLDVYDDPPEEPEVTDEDEDDSSGNSGDKVEIVIAYWYFGDQEEQAEILAGLQEEGYDIILNSDGNFVLTMTKEEHQELMDDTRTSIEDEIEYLKTNAPGVERVEANDNFSEVTIYVTKEFMGDDYVGRLYLMSFGFSAPTYQEYNGDGPGSTTKITVIDVNTNEVYVSVIAPDELASLYED